MYTKYDYFAFIDDLSIYSETGKIIHLTKREYTYYKSQGLNYSDIKVMLSVTGIQFSLNDLKLPPALIFPVLGFTYFLTSEFNEQTNCMG